jgi:phosphoribosylformimino-5-aminoimidazole carboxamide ribotide isomerase
LKIIPVLDIMNGVAVHAIKGQRKQYQPLKSQLCGSSNPLDIALAFERLGFTELYIADLDAILGENRDLSPMRRIAKLSKIKLIVDAAVSNLDQAKGVLEAGVSKLIIGTETLLNADFVEEALRSFGKDRVIVSLDFMNGIMIGNLGERTSSPLELLGAFHNMGLRQLIVLDLARVGSAQGANTDLLKQLTSKLDLELYVGGGIRNIPDLLNLRAIGARGALVATALHSGAITVAELNAENMEL